MGTDEAAQTEFLFLTGVAALLFGSLGDVAQGLDIRVAEFRQVSVAGVLELRLSTRTFMGYALRR